MLRLVMTAIVVLSAGVLFRADRPAPGLAEEAAATVGYSLGVVDEHLGAGSLPAFPGHELVLRRVTIEPQGRLTAHTHPGSLVISVESGSWAYTPLAGTAWLTQRDAPGLAGTIPAPLIANSALSYDPGPTASGITRELQHGTEVVLSAGAVLILQDPEARFVNHGDEPVVLLVAGMSPIGEPFTTLTPNRETVPSAP
jgi:hypothetical protein